MLYNDNEAFSAFLLSHIYSKDYLHGFSCKEGFRNQNFSVLKKQIKSFVLSTVRFAKESLL